MKVRIGDIVEIYTGKGFAYALYTHKIPSWGALLRVFDTLYNSRPDQIAAIAKGQVRFSTFFPLQAALKAGCVEAVGNVPVPEHLQNLPLFRAAGHIDPTTHRVREWWLWDGQKEWRVGDLTKEQRALPLRAVWNDTLLRERIEADWRPERDAR